MKYSSTSSYSLSGVAGTRSLANMKGSINKPVLDNGEEHADVVPRCAIIEVKKKWRDVDDIKYLERESSQKCWAAVESKVGQ